MQTRIVTRAIIHKGNKLLLSRDQGLDFWYPGGGEWEADEDLTECAVREVNEETGQKIKVLGLMYVHEFYINKDKRNLELFFLAQPLEDSQTNHYHEDMDKAGHTRVEENRWFSEEEMEKIKVYPDFFRERVWQDIKNFDKDKPLYFKRKQEE